MLSYYPMSKIVNNVAPIITRFPQKTRKKNVVYHILFLSSSHTSFGIGFAIFIFG
jgi:hypothetical protein